MKINQILILFMVLVTAAGCGTRQPDDLGTQIGTITEVFDVGVEPVDLPDCRVPLKPEELSTGRYMQVHFMSYRLHRSVNAFVPLSKEFKQGDKVVVRHPYCVGSHKPEITAVAVE